MNAGHDQPDARGSADSQRPRDEREGFGEDFSHDIIGAAVEVQRVLGVGLLESAYADAFALELEQRNLRFERDVAIAAVYKGIEVGTPYRADFVVEGSVIVELKTIEGSADVHRARLLSYLRISGLKLALLINFSAFPVVKGIYRLVNKP